jgi:hypothetical protein
MKILDKLKEFFAKGPKELKEDPIKKDFPHHILKKKKQELPELHHHNHGSSTT